MTEREARLVKYLIHRAIKGSSGLIRTSYQELKDAAGIEEGVNQWYKPVRRLLDDFKEAGFIDWEGNPSLVLVTLRQFLPGPQDGLNSPYYGLSSPQHGLNVPQHGLLSPYYGPNSPQHGLSENKDLPPSPSSPFSPPLSLSPTPPLSIPTPLSPSSTPTVALQDAQVEEDKKKKEDKDDKTTPGTLNLHPDLHPKSTRSRRPIPPDLPPPPLPTWEEAVAYAENFIGDGKPVPEDQRAFALDDLEWLVNRSGRLETARDWKLSINLFLRKKVSMRAKRDTALGASTTSRTPPSAVLTLGDNKNAPNGLTGHQRRALPQVLNTRKRLEGELADLQRAKRQNPWSDKIDLAGMAAPGVHDAFKDLEAQEQCLKNQLRLVNAELEGVAV